MIARLDTLLPPLDPATGLYGLLAIAMACLALWFADRRRQHREPPSDPYAEAHGDVTRRPDA